MWLDRGELEKAAAFGARGRGRVRARALAAPGALLWPRRLPAQALQAQEVVLGRDSRLSGAPPERASGKSTAVAAAWTGPAAGRMLGPR
ncbi:MAG: hypothetical protein ACRD1R_07275 [Acidobacteriota bacterium]